MNTPSLLENQLKSWTPRRPSPTGRSRLFGAAERPERSPALTLAWLAPAACLLLVLSVSFVPRSERLSLGTRPAGSMMALTLSNQSLAAYLPGSFRGQRNHLAADRVGERFGWTKPGALLPSNPSVGQFRTNYLKH